MVTLISQRDSSGKRRGCTARCYNAKRDVCRCICGHANHGVGLQKATENTTKRAEEILKAHTATQVQLELT